MEKLNVLEYVSNEYIELKKYIEKSDKNYHLTIFQIGDNPASNRYINNKIKKMNMLGIKHKHIKYTENITKEEIMNDMSQISDKGMLQMPVPKHLEKTVDFLFKKDVDGLSVANLHNFYIGKPSNIPCTARGILEYMRFIDPNLDGKSVLIINRSNLVGKPLKELLLKENMLVSIAHSHISKEKILEILLNYDYIISGVGEPNFLSSDDIPEGATFIDVSINFDENNKMCGDLKINPDTKTNFRYTPVPNGVGQLTVLALMKNILNIPI